MLLLFRVGALVSRMGGAQTQPCQCYSCGTRAPADVCMHCFHTPLLELTHQLLYLCIYVSQNLTSTGMCRDH